MLSFLPQLFILRHFIIFIVYNKKGSIWLCKLKSITIFIKSTLRTNTLAMFMTGLFAQTNNQDPYIQKAAQGFATGIMLFCGSLYPLSYTKWKILGPVTPIGGLLFIYGWLNLFMAAWRMNGVKSDWGILKLSIKFELYFEFICKF